MADFDPKPFTVMQFCGFWGKTYDHLTHDYIKIIPMHDTRLSEYK